MNPAHILIAADHPRLRSGVRRFPECAWPSPASAPAWQHRKKTRRI
jgi:hypothetical protein